MDLTLGARLRSQRERQDVALATIAAETKINVALLEGLERDDLSRWPGGLFRRAYVRTYAQKIGLDPEQVVREFLEQYPDPIDATSPVEAIVQNAESKRPKTRIGLMIAGLARRRSHRTDGRILAVSPPVLPEIAVPSLLEPRFEPEPEPEPELAFEPEPVAQTVEIAEPPAPRLVMIPSPDSNVDARRDVRAIERGVAWAAQLCTRIACARDDQDLGSAMEEVVAVLDAAGAILWVWDAERDVLSAALAHGYSDELLSKLPEVGRRDDNAIAAAFRCGQKQVVRGADDATGAFVTPLMTPEGCVGVLALEFADGAEQHELVQALSTIITAQLSTLFAPAPHVVEEEWDQPDRSLVAS
jgi:hypothetical protein